MPFLNDFQHLETVCAALLALHMSPDLKFPSQDTSPGIIPGTFHPTRISRNLFTSQLVLLLTATTNTTKAPQLLILSSQNENPPDTAAGERDSQAKKSTVDMSFERLLREVAKFDEEQVKGWKEDIDTLLVFAGLFSAVVTAFLIEAYQQLEEDPADKTVALLEQLVSLQRPNASQTMAVTSDSSSFTPNASTVRINCFWLLSLIFSLTSALFGLLCKQWIREYQREPPTSSPGEALALRQLRRDSFEKWGVPGFLSALPILLEVALLFFFAGILDLLSGLHQIPFVVSLVAIGLSVGLYFITTFLPTLTISKDQKWNITRGRFEQLSYQFICPYKSPQAWAFYRLVSKAGLLLYAFLHSTLWRWTRHSTMLFRLVYDLDKPPASDWSSFDLRVIRQYDEHVYLGNENSFALQIYHLRAFEWAVTMFCDNPSMIPHLQNVLGTIPPSVAMSAVLGRWNIGLWTDVTKADVDLAVRDPSKFSKHPSTQLLEYRRIFPAVPKFTIRQPEGIRFSFKHQYLMSPEADDDFRDAFERMGVKTAGFHFVVPLSVAGGLWVHQDPGVREWSLALLQLYQESWKSCTAVEIGDILSPLHERVTFAWTIAKHINRPDRTSVLITSKQGQQFIRYIHHHIVVQKIYIYPLWRDFCCDEWQAAIKKMQDVGNLSSSYFVPLPERDDSQPSFPLVRPFRYFPETPPDVEFDHDSQMSGSESDGETSNDENELDILTLGDLTTSEDRVDAPGSLSIQIGERITSPEGGGPLAQDDVQDTKDGLVIGVGDTQDQDTPTEVLPKIAGSPAHSVEAEGNPHVLSSAHVELDAQDHDTRLRSEKNARNTDNLDLGSLTTVRGVTRSEKHTESLDVIDEPPALVEVQSSAAPSTQECDIQHVGGNSSIALPRSQVTDQERAETGPSAEQACTTNPGAITANDCSPSSHSDESKGVEQHQVPGAAQSSETAVADSVPDTSRTGNVDSASERTLAPASSEHHGVESDRGGYEEDV
ncbi:hypothetical protein VNI00_010785 [Paramarasmius palmivorus]|uniref:DUF6535 domain-containing protein n=1 Tax=Paramarasmius palmivorus TaxID=297713 RepID=A0AAW0CCF2_9AGAR